MENPDQEKKTKGGKLSKWKDIIDIAHSIFVILAIICAGYWFYKQGEIRPKADITHEITYLNIHKDKKLVHVLINIKNIGHTPIVITKGTLRIQKIMPLDDKLRQKIEIGEDIVDEEYGKVPWPYACEHGECDNLIIDPVTIEVGETYPIDREFNISRDVSAIRVYSYFNNPNRPYSKWGTAKVYDIE